MSNEPSAPQDGTGPGSGDRAVDAERFTARGEAAERAAFRGDGAYSGGEFAGGADRGRPAGDVEPADPMP
ncbi:hypothetical protein [Nakamurella sp.]|uniref:hypothetical protein n=1 Tax=Nakamurella sp. TaxID=1869182 RepID=UPI003B3B50D6